MRALIQRVNRASVTVEEEVVGAIGRGLCVFVGVTHSDDEAVADKLAERVWRLRVFDDDAGFMNVPVAEAGGEVLVVSQFTLYGDTRKGRRPSKPSGPGWPRAASPPTCTSSSSTTGRSRSRSNPDKWSQSVVRPGFAGAFAGHGGTTPGGPLAFPGGAARCSGAGTFQDWSALMERIDSCHSVWLFDTERMRFRRVPKEMSIDTPALESDWEPYYGLEISPDSGAFAVALNPTRTRLLRSWRHREPCEHCAPVTVDLDATGEVSLAEASEQNTV